MKRNFKLAASSISILLFVSQFAQAQESSTQVRVDTSAMTAILTASPVVQLTLILLVVLSVLCWAVALSKHKQFKGMESQNDAFNKKFWKVSSLDTLYEDLDAYPHSSLARVFKDGYDEMQRLAESPLGGAKKESPSLSGMDNLERTLRKSIDSEIGHMESRLNLLATTGSTGPFIGLFGTVWGIMGSFQKIGAMGSASLAVVAPGISEALIATAIGLAAAIPAVTLYNHFVSRVRRQEVELTNFSTDFLNVVKRNFFRE